jgi:hypothetical protein
MNLKSFGCSFIFGSDLHDDGLDGTWSTPSQYSWPALVSKQLGYNYSCYARPGSGNLQIADRVLSQLEDLTPAIYVIGWSWIDRFDYYSNEYTWTDGRCWKTLRPNESSDINRTYYRHLHSQLQDKLYSLITIRVVIERIKQKNIPFIMTYIDELLFETEYHTTPAIAELQKYIQPYMTAFEGKTFLDWAKEKQFPISPTMHPLEEAHCAAQELMIKVFDKQNTSGLAQ